MTRFYPLEGQVLHNAVDYCLRNIDAQIGHLLFYLGVSGFVFAEQLVNQLFVLLVIPFRPFSVFSTSVSHWIQMRVFASFFCLSKLRYNTDLAVPYFTYLGYVFYRYAMIPAEFLGGNFCSSVCIPCFHKPTTSCRRTAVTICFAFVSSFQVFFWRRSFSSSLNGVRLRFDKINIPVSVRHEFWYLVFGTKTLSVSDWSDRSVAHDCLTEHYDVSHWLLTIS